MRHELLKAGWGVESQVGLPVLYDGLRLENGFRMDLVVENAVVIELKSVETLLEAHHKQLLTYLKLSGHKLGLLISFHVPVIKEGVFRKVNELQALCTLCENTAPSAGKLSSAFHP